MKLVLNVKDQRKCMVHFEDKGRVCKSALEDCGGFRKVPSWNTEWIWVKGKVTYVHLIPIVYI